MKFHFDCTENIEALLVKTAESLDDFAGEFDPQIRPADERFGDFQANGVLPYAKKMGQNPREMAQRIIDALPKTEDWEVSLAGPGFINFKLSPGFLLGWVLAWSTGRSGGRCPCPETERDRDRLLFSQYGQANARWAHPFNHHR